MLLCYLNSILIALFLWNSPKERFPNQAHDLNVHSDTIHVTSRSISVLHYHNESRELERKMLNMQRDELIFSDSFNDFSRLKIFTGNDKEIELSTVPLDEIVVLEDREIIIGFSKVSLSPYHIVLYSFDGALIYKGAFPTLVLKLTSNRVQEICKQYPEFYHCLVEDENLFCFEKTYYFSLSRCMRSTLGADNINEVFKPGELVGNQYFDFEISNENRSSAKFVRNKGGYNETNPFYDLLMVGHSPYLLILNDEKGNKVNIPLVSNCSLSSLEINKK